MGGDRRLLTPYHCFEGFFQICAEEDRPTGLLSKPELFLDQIA